MTENKRIALNTIATYGRSIFGILCGIFSTRWVLTALGQVDFGVYGIMGSMVIFISFLNIQFSSAVSRYYAFSIGEARGAANKKIALDECRSWFSIALLVHTVLPLILVAIGYPLGVYSLTNGIVIVPPDRIDVCIWLWRFVCLTCLIGMVGVPFQAMYTAKQYIAELTIYSFLQTIVRTAFIYYMVEHPRDWLLGYGFGMFLIMSLPMVVISIRAVCVFPECRVRFSSLKELWRVRKLGEYALWQSFGGVGYIACHQGMGILINNAFGARIAGSFSVAQTVAAEAASLTGALQGAFTPAITTACGAQQLDRMRFLALRACRYGTFLTLMFAIPMALEIKQILLLWLGNPPPAAAELCLNMLAFISIEKLSIGHLTAVNASGKVAKFQIYRGVLGVSAIPIALTIWIAGGGAALTSTSLPLSVALVVCCDILLARDRVGMRVLSWFKSVFVPVFVVSLASVLFGIIPLILMQPSFFRIVITTACSLLAMLSVFWLWGMDVDEKTALKCVVERKFGCRRSCHEG